MLSGFFVYDGFNILDLTGPFEVLSTANRMMIESGYSEKYIINICSLYGGRVSSNSGIHIDTCSIKEFLNIKINSLVFIGGLEAENIAKERDCIFYLKNFLPENTATSMLLF
ncbi:hypothetical protein [Klebsiella variicola]|uniref:hypothetical protein n=1 Tax=Klebsiella variicola TaxID=244366 RepID=UPI002B052152|nr:hypothetical protein [Klebsiella variicola]